ncbi:bifunctional molybdenum cofactor biosynthesis protein MoaC/MoaB [Pseudolysinimonas kribbensis]|uniref:Cyclic pyranopterin monophosphate synthase n=1 Tax=Pseudolysinimonas kribbensis TaxID=433641 RepID=A0ABQ6K3L8_9MICO|nr:bifunctional molybdenum cofactor biosynthesis protein MoaC/MoaB [Pseudolysinimonas kribbensis]GMA95048.1 molybdenum cofactor biosynthesis bifunctional protein [Pseudolysinimonas kribbensis]
MSGLSHVDDEGRARMVDVGGKPVTRRTAVASGRLDTTAEVIGLVRDERMPKRDVLATARLAGIQGAKRTSELIPLAHPLPLDTVEVEVELHDTWMAISATAVVTGRTGVEMEALTAVAVAGLTLHDMVKAVDPGCVLGDIRLVSKTGGKSDIGVANVSDAAIVLVSSTRAAAGEREDATGPAIAEWASAQGLAPEVRVVADKEIASALRAAVSERPALVVTTGGTGASPSDRTPEATLAVIERELPGVAEAIRAAGLAKVPTAALSRGVAGLAGGTIVVNLPGSTGGVRDGLGVLDALLPHLRDQLAGGDHA